MDLKLKKYLEQANCWPSNGKHILAQYDDNSIVVYQAYRPEIGLFASENQYFGGAFSYSRMSWIKPNFLWMMYRSGWGTKVGQEITLAIRLKRSFFENILLNAVSSSFHSSAKTKIEDWREALQNSNVRLQWDPDHDPFGAKQERRAIQLGLRNDMLAPFEGDGIIDIQDISKFVANQRSFVEENRLHELETPFESVYEPKDISRLDEIGLTTYFRKPTLNRR